jgi:hypothetical protein
MSDNYTEPVEDDADGSEDFKNLRAKARKADQYERELAQMKREVAFMKAGIPMEDPRIGYFVKGYDGDLDPQAIRTAAVDAGFIQIQQPAPDPAVEQARDGQSRVMNATGGTVPQFDTAGVDYAMQQAYAEGGLEGLSAVAQQYGVTFQPEEV